LNNHNQSRLTHRIRKVSDEQQALLSDTRNFYATAFVKTIQKTSGRYSHVMDLWNNTQNKTQKGLILKGYYDNHLIHMLPKIEDIELVKVFGLEVAEKYRIHTTKKTSKSWDVESDSGLEQLMESYKEEMFNLIQLKDILLKFCDNTIIGMDAQLEENYDMIRKTYFKK